MFRQGTRIVAECIDMVVIGTLVRDYVELDGVVAVKDEHDGQVLNLNAWLWTIEVVDPGEGVSGERSGGWWPGAP